MTGCWSEDDGETYMWSKPEYTAFLTVEKALATLSDSLLSVGEKGETLLDHEKLELKIHRPYYYDAGYSIEANNLHLVWETMPGKDANRWGPIANIRIKGACTIRTTDEQPLVLEVQVENELYLKSTREWGWVIYDYPEARLLSGRMHVKVSGGHTGDLPTEFTATRNAGETVIEKNGRKETI